MRKESHRPVRTCLGCMRKDLKSAMVRVTESGGAIVCEQGDLHAGRGGYLHPREECLERFVRSRVKEFRSLRRAIDRPARQRIAESIRARLDRSRRVE